MSDRRELEAIREAVALRRESLRQQIRDYNSTKAKTNRQKERIEELEEGNRLAVAEAYRCGFEAGKKEMDAEIKYQQHMADKEYRRYKKLQAELAALREAIKNRPNTFVSEVPEFQALLQEKGE